jgi:hypothetical protein
MAKKKKGMSDDEILVVVDKAVSDSVGYFDSQLSREREKVLNYYNGVLPKPVHAGNSKYISMDVYDTVESAKAVLLETFAAGNKLVEFTPVGPEDVQAAKIATDYTDYVIFRQNNGYQVFSDALTDGMLARVGIAKVYWDKREVETTEEFADLSADQFDQLLSQPDVELEDYTQDDATLLISGSIIRSANESQVVIENIPPEEFLISSRAKSLTQADFVGQRVRKSKSDLIKDGYDKDIVDRISFDEHVGLNEENARFTEIDATSAFNRQAYQDAVSKVTVYECYMQIDVEGDGEACLYKIIKAGNEILHKEEVDRVPFITNVPLPIPHSFFGSNFASKVIPIQNARTVLMRGILDHTVITNNPRYQVVKGALVNPRELLDNRIGGVVNVTRPDGIMPLQQASLNPFVFQTIQLLDEDKEDTTGISKLSQGLNKDAVSQQNSGAMVEQLVSLSQQRQKIMARNFANNFLIPLYLEVYRLVIENEDKKKVVEIAGNWVEVEPQRWRERRDVQASLRLGYGEQEKDAQKYLAIHQLLTSDPGLQPLYTIKNRYTNICNFLEASGFKNTEEIITAPDHVPPPQPDPMQVVQLEAAKKQIEVADRQVAVQEVKAKAEAELDHMKVEMERMKTMIDVMMKQRDAERKEFDSKERAKIAEAELSLMQNTPTEVKQTQIVSPS